MIALHLKDYQADGVHYIFFCVKKDYGFEVRNYLGKKYAKFLKDKKKPLTVEKYPYTKEKYDVYDWESIFLGYYLRDAFINIQKGNIS